jgi:hypothetical protein
MLLIAVLPTAAFGKCSVGEVQCQGTPYLIDCPADLTGYVEHAVTCYYASGADSIPPQQDAMGKEAYIANHCASQYDDRARLREKYRRSPLLSVLDEAEAYLPAPE